MLWGLFFFFLIGSALEVDATDTYCTNGTIKIEGNFTSQSSNYIDENCNFTSDRAVDGEHMVCAHTLEQNNSWWEVDLQSIYNISSISIYNKLQSNIDMEDAEIYIGYSHQNSSTLNNKKCTTIKNFTSGICNCFRCDTALLGRYVTVFLPRERHLILCEVKIYGTREESPLMLFKSKKTWEDALYECREKNMKLVSILDKETQAWAVLEAEKADTSFIWLGFHYTCILDFWFWVDDQPPSNFQKWAPDGKISDCDRSAAMEKKEDHLWYSKSVYDSFNFICAK